MHPPTHPPHTLADDQDNTPPEVAVFSRSPHPTMREHQPGAAAISLQQLQQQHLAGSRWFYWIAALTIINSLLTLGESGWSFIVGLGITQLIDGVSSILRAEVADGATVIMIITLGLDVGIAAVMAGFGWLATRGQRWAMIVGMCIYALDGLLFLLVEDWLSIGFHAFALWCMYNGLKALNQLRVLPPPALALTSSRQRTGIAAWWNDYESREQLKRSARRLGLIAVIGATVVGVVQLLVVLLP